MKRMLAAVATLCAGAAQAMTDAELKSVVERRLSGDRTGACFAVAVIDDEIARTYVCANAKDAGRIDSKTAFELGSVTKTLTATLFADLMAQGKVSLEAPLASLLPKGTKVPTFQGKPILLKHIVTHTSGLPSLPSRLPLKDPANPYADLDEKTLLESLADVKLEQAPGSRFEYSNFGMMLLSAGIARRAGVDFETLLDRRLFTPLGMEGAYVNERPDTVRVATGHLPNGQPTSAWTFATNLAGVGGVHATLDDMVRYVEAGLGRRKSSITPAVQRTLRPIETPSGQRMGMSWMLTPLVGRTVHVHEGGTGGFTSLVALDVQQRRGVVVLSDTALLSLNGLGSLGMHLLDASVPPGEPRKVVAADPALMDALVGHYELTGGLKLRLGRKGNALEIQAEGQPAFELGYDSAGDFFPLAFDAVLRPKRLEGGGYGFTWIQLGAESEARRVDAQ
ncbi:beta-lactamase family protein [Archangium violaceum]|uniref:serine hydrolase n=1 Tax=Archangium violaceum TaxID=83451 RepID=UPI002B2A5DFD|nr:beta-lactamase family protein [Archangium violaceum]